MIHDRLVHQNTWLTVLNVCLHLHHSFPSYQWDHRSQKSPDLWSAGIQKIKIELAVYVSLLDAYHIVQFTASRHLCSPLPNSARGWGLRSASQLTSLCPVLVTWQSRANQNSCIEEVRINQNTQETRLIEVAAYRFRCESHLTLGQRVEELVNAIWDYVPTKSIKLTTSLSYKKKSLRPVLAQ